MFEWVSENKDKKIDNIYLHVQEGNDAIKFYSQFGFEESGKIENYYSKIQPATAIILRKKVTGENAENVVQEN